MKKKLSVFIVPDSGRIRQYSLSKTLTLFLAATFCIYTGASLVFSFDFFSRKVEAHRVDSLAKENRFLTVKLAMITDSIDSLHGEISSLVDKERAIRTIYELPEIDQQQRELGIGGPDLLPNYADDSPSRAAAFQSEADVVRLLALSSFEKEQFNNIYLRLLEKKSDLDHTPSISPTHGYLIRGFGIKVDPFTGEQRQHAGLDISNRIGTPVVVTANGKVAYEGFQSGLGNTLIIDHGNGFQTVYGHLSQFKVRIGEQVSRGELIGLIGNTGYSTGPHLHYEVTRFGSSLNPAKFIISGI